jgi:hypothetical protein
MVDGKDFRLADLRYVQRCAARHDGRAARHDGRIVTIGQLILFSTETGDAWLLDKEDGLAAPLAQDGDPEPIHIEETDANFTIEWKGDYRIEGSQFRGTPMWVPPSARPQLDQMGAGFQRYSDGRHEIGRTIHQQVRLSAKVASIGLHPLASVVAKGNSRLTL